MVLRLSKWSENTTYTHACTHTHAYTRVRAHAHTHTHTFLHSNGSQVQGTGTHTDWEVLLMPPLFENFGWGMAWFYSLSLHVFVCLPHLALFAGVLYDPLPWLAESWLRHVPGQYRLSDGVLLSVGKCSYMYIVVLVMNSFSGFDTYSEILP